MAKRKLPCSLTRKQFLQSKKDLQKLELIRREQTKKGCSHRRIDGSFNIKWMRHSNDLVMGVCGSCASQFDISNPEDLKIFISSLQSASVVNMGVANLHEGESYSIPFLPDRSERYSLVPIVDDPEPKPTFWERIKRVLLK